ncbi:CD48 antigen-like isoform X2 [Puntigrus tetrazona]|uniref:CD48 antigen-like isoform X2 n=1 Tax=Puntigrus tetrazona TaxID=1606681 RepID=UPI001C8A8FCD|nr:CD48 antigen-like isoform X2 [Puntigrus tetrazona]
MSYTFVLFCFCWWSPSGVFGESVSVMEGDAVTLTDVTEIHKDNEIVLKFGPAKPVKIFPTLDVPGGIFRDRLKLDDQTGSLTIMNVTTQHAGVYQLERDGVKFTYKTYNVSVYARLTVPNITRDCSSSSSNCSLLCSAVNVGHVTLSWYKGNSLLSSISVSDLSISLSLPLEVEYQDKNTYSCVINNPIRNQTTHLNITKLCQTCSDSVSLITLVSVSAGSLLIVAAGIFCICRRHRKSDQEGQTCEEEIIYTDPTFHKRKAQRSYVIKEDHVEYAPIAVRR